MSTFIDNHSEILKYSALISIVTFFTSLVVIPWIVVRLPADFFSSPKTIWNGARRRHPLLVILLLLVKNGLGLILLAAGVAMLVLPGQGLLTIVISMGMINFPGKHKMLSRLVQIPSVFKTLNWIRRKSFQKPFEHPTTHYETVSSREAENEK